MDIKCMWNVLISKYNDKTVLLSYWYRLTVNCYIGVMLNCFVILTLKEQKLWENSLKIIISIIIKCDLYEYFSICIISNKSCQTNPWC